MQTIAMENNLSETVFYVPKGNDFHIRWFTPMIEVNLCGHATLATAHVMYHHKDYQKPQINFHSRSGLLSVKKNGEMFTLDFPANAPVEIETPGAIVESINVLPVEVYNGKDLMVVLNSQAEIETLNPKINFIALAHPQGVIFTAKGKEVDFVSRCFYPNLGINEDPVTGSAHTILTPYWAVKLGKAKLTAKQLSKRGGNLVCELKGARVEISGKAITYMSGEIEV
jgi:PhzF family phenazine biosynthesis protein